MTGPQLRLEVEDDPAGIPNLIANPSGVLGAWGWVTPAANMRTLAVQSGPPATDNGWSLRVQQINVAGIPYAASELAPVNAGAFVAARWDDVGRPSTFFTRGRLEFYTAAGAFISAGAYTAWVQQPASGVQATRYLAAMAAPATTAYARIRIEGSTTIAGANAPAGSLFDFRRVMLTTAASSAALGSIRRNLVRNPSFETNLTGWDAGVYGGISGGTVTKSRPADAGAYPGPSYLRAQLNAGDIGSNVGIQLSCASNTYGPNGITEGMDHAISALIRVGAGAGATVWIWNQWRNAAGSVIGSTPGQTWTVAGSGWVRYGYVATAPAGAVGANLLIVMRDGTPNPKFIDLDAVLVEQASAVSADYFDGARAAGGGMTYAWTGTPHASESTATAAAASFAYVEPITWRNIIGPAISLQAERAALDAGTLAGTLRDDQLDPAVDDTLKPGRRCRVLAWNGTSWRPIITTKLQRAEATYDKRKEAGAQVRARITIAGTDNGQVLANTPERRGVAAVADLPFILEGAGVPWDVAGVPGGNGGQVYSANLASTNDRASLLDQVAVTRDTARAFAYVSTEGQLVVTTAPVASGVTFSDEAGGKGYVGIGVGYSTDECINSVMVKWLRYDALAGTTEEVSYGPYEDAVSIRDNGTHSRTFTIHGAAEDPAAIAAYGAAVLAANKTPAKKVRQLVVNVTSDVLVNAVLDAELTKTVTIRYAGVDYSGRVSSVSHKLSSDRKTGTRWTATITFDQATTVAQPTVIPNPAGGNNSLLPSGVGFTVAPTYGSTDPPNATTGILFSTRAGVMRGLISGTAYTVNGSVGIVLRAYIDGVQVGACYIQPSLSQGVRLQLPPIGFTKNVAAGDHYLYLKLEAGSWAAGQEVLSMFAQVSET